ncbi:MAG: O-antigen ligase family protein, partial [Salinivirgaceae bacterium]|nr:O-antigen ligase family protein [Salinivirgaceae bacterium]
LTLWVDGARYQLGYMLIGLGLILSRRFNFHYGKFIQIIFVQSIIIICIAWIEFFHVEIIEVMYGIAKSEMKNTTLAIGSRLISVMGNPINLGAFTCLSLIVFQFMYSAKRVSRITYYLLIVASAFVCFFTFSRLAMMVYFFLFIFISIRNKDWFVVAFACLIVLFVASTLSVSDLATASNINTEHLINRVAGMLEGRTYSENIRVIHWAAAINALDNLVYFLWGLGFGVSNPSMDTGGFIVENAFVSVLVETGFFGLFIYLSYILLCMMNLTFRKKTMGREARQFCIFFLIFFVILSVGNDFNRNLPFVLYFWLFTAGIFVQKNGVTK